MAKLQLNKSALAREAQSLRNYARFLPSLDLKRQQLMAERAKAVRTLSQTRGEIEALRREVGRALPMLSNYDVDLTGLVRVTNVRLGTENLVGIQLPRLEAVNVEVKAYALLAKPHWVDRAVVVLREVLELRVRVQVEERRLTLLTEAVKTITQRVNLFEKVLIPNTRANIKRIRLYLSDEEMAAVVRSKIAKRKRAAEGGMTILRLKKITLCGLLREKRALLEGLQGLGCMHLLPLRPRPTEVENVVSPRAETAFKALRFLSDMPQKRRQVRRDPRFDVGSLVQDALALKQGLRDATDRRDFLQHRIAAVEPWGDLVFPPHEALVGYRLWFYILPLALLNALDSVHLPWQILRKDHRFAYLVLIAKEEPAGDLLPVPRTHTGALPLGELKARLEEVEIELEDLVAQRQALTRYIYLLSVNLAEAENQASLSYAEQQTRDGDSLVAVQGWVPADAVVAVEAYAREAGLACLIEEPGAKDEPPTLIEQPDELAAGADMAVFYQVPGYRSWDPTLLLVASFSLFFAMILADAGYGTVLIAGLFCFWRRLGRSRKSRSYRTLGLSLFGCTISYGVIVGSYFGVTPPPDSLPGQLHVLSVNDFDSMMKLSVVIGVLHIVFANAMAAYVRCRSLVALSKLGWIAGIFGGLTLWLAGGDASWTLAGQALIGIGLLAVLFFSSERPVSKPSDYFWRLADGVKSLTGVMGAFGDVLSYMRLFALGLASASLAVTFNDLATSVHEAMPGIGLLAAILILAIGHSLNLGLSLMSGVVHGLRLNFIEFYKWGLPEEGTAFRKFARKEVQL